MAKIGCVCGHVFSTVTSPNGSMQVVRNSDQAAYAEHVWRTYQLSDIERNGMLPPKGSAESEAFHASLDAGLELEGELWECPDCARLLFRRPGEENFRVFEQKDPD